MTVAAVPGYDLAHQTWEQLQQLVSGGAGGALGGDLSGSLSAATVATVLGGHLPLRADLNLSDIVAVATARFNLGVQPANLADYGVVYDAQHLTNCTWTTGTGVLVDSSATGKFSAGDVGKKVVIKGASATANQDLATTIASFQSANQVTTTVTAGTTVAGALVAWGTDQTASLQAAVNSGQPLMMPAGEFLTQQVTIKAGFSLVGFGASSKIWSAGTGTGNGCVFKQITSDGVTLQQGFRLSGVELHGWFAVNSVSNTPIWLQQWQSIYIDGCLFDGFQQGVNFLDCSQGYLIKNRVTNMAGGSNALDIHDSITGSPTNTPITEWFVLQNDIANATASGIDITVGYTIPVTPTRAVIVGNRVLMNTSFGCISLEIGLGSGSGLLSTPGKIQEVIIALNILHQDGTGYCIVLEDDGSTGSSATDKLQDILILGNTCVATGTTQGTISVQGYRITSAVNILVISGSKHGFFTNANPSANPSNHLKFFGNIIYANGSGTPFFVQNSTDVQLEHNLVEHGASATSTQSFFFTNVQRLDVDGNRINNAPNIGMYLNSNVGDYNLVENKIYNCNAAGGTGGVTGTGIVVTNTTGQGGLSNLIERNTIWDDRGTHLMQYAVQNTNALGTKPRLLDNRMYGAVNAPTPAVGNFLRIRGNDTDAGSWPAQPAGVTIGASPATYTNTDPYDEELYYFGGSGVSLVQISIDGGVTFSTISGTTNGHAFLKGNGQGALKITYSTTAPSATKVPNP